MPDSPVASTPVPPPADASARTPTGTTAPSPPAPTPDPRRLRPWLVAVAESLGAVLFGTLLLLLSFGTVLAEFADNPPDGLVALHLGDLLIGLLIGVLIGPLRFLAHTRTGTALHLLAVTLSGFSLAGLPAGLIALYRLGRKRRLWLDLCAIALLLAATLGLLSLDSMARGTGADGTWSIAVIISIAIAVTALVLGRLSGTRAALVASLRQQAEAAERERIAAEQAREAAEHARASAEQARASTERARASAEAQVRAEERTAIARDMHDSVSHHLATIAMHAGAMSYRKDLPPEQLRSIATTVRDAAQQANAELREVLVALRSDEGSQPLATAPALQDIVDRARLRGQPVTLTWKDVDAEALDRRGRSTVVALSRVLTEMITNAAKHAPGAPLTVLLHRREDRLVMTAVNPHPSTDSTAPADAADDLAGPVLSTGHGLIGLQERARLLGGDVRIEDDGTTFRVEAWMPW